MGCSAKSGEVRVFWSGNSELQDTGRWPAGEDLAIMVGAVAPLAAADGSAIVALKEISAQLSGLLVPDRAYPMMGSENSSI